MIRASAGTQDLVQRLCRQATEIAAAFAAQHASASARGDWYSARALWPDLFGENRDGK
jgi:hypothetical protein